MNDEPGDMRKHPETMKNVLIVGVVALAAVILIFVVISILGGGGGTTQTGSCG